MLEAAPTGVGTRRRLPLVRELMHDGRLQDALLDWRCPELMDWACQLVALDITCDL